MAEKAQPQVKIGHYIIGDTLGVGTFGKVKRKHHASIYLFPMSAKLQTSGFFDFCIFSNSHFRFADLSSSCLSVSLTVFDVFILSSTSDSNRGKRGFR